MDPVDARDVRVVQRGEHAGFALEARQPLGVAGEGVGQDLDRHVAVERRVDGLPDDAHPALADLLGQAVVQELLAGSEFQGSSDSGTDHTPRARSGRLESFLVV